MASILGIFSKFGSIIPRLRKKKTVIETLEDIDKKIKDYEKYKQRNEVNERKYIGALVLYSILFYIFGAIVYYIYLFPTNISDQVKTSIPFFISPILIYSLRRFLKWFFIKRTKSFSKKLEDLRLEKKTILEDVKEKETYKKAREILERFGDGVEISITPPSTPALNKTIASATPFNNTVISQQMPGTTLVHRNVRALQQNQMNTSKSALNSTINNNLNTTINRMGSSSSLASDAAPKPTQPIPTQTLGPVQQQQSQMVPPPQPPSSLGVSQARTLLPRPIITPNRTFFDKILDFIIGEGPNNRYALICKNCHFHNGMALKEEFEYVAFRCAYCLFYNEARKTKLNVPVLNNRSNRDSSKEIKTNTKLNESADSSLSTSDSLNDIDPMSENLGSDSNEIDQRKKSVSSEALKLDASGDKRKPLNDDQKEEEKIQE
ncbi:unnamed protein product [Brachionus calyciflorus]|uniref:Endoplasmic reticulum junction formation protein lunapark n=1 Tax=Brachionus calyciflorus TaxID=104777 RepID=A0A814D3J9_9BILA|nr:unnamed protein product [Brachionus calyciflorus]